VARAAGRVGAGGAVAVVAIAERLPPHHRHAHPRHDLRGTDFFLLFFFFFLVVFLLALWLWSQLESASHRITAMHILGMTSEVGGCLTCLGGVFELLFLGGGEPLPPIIFTLRRWRRAAILSLAAVRAS
jgi:hypothetical protein